MQYAPAGSAEALLQELRNIAIAMVCIGCLTLVSSFAFLTAVLAIATGSVAIATMKSLHKALSIAGGIRPNCSYPIHARNLSIAVATFAGLEFIENAAVLGITQSSDNIAAYCQSTYYSYNNGRYVYSLSSACVSTFRFIGAFSGLALGYTLILMGLAIAFAARFEQLNKAVGMALTHPIQAALPGYASQCAHQQQLCKAALMPQTPVMAAEAINRLAIDDQVMLLQAKINAACGQLDINPKSLPPGVSSMEAVVFLSQQLAQLNSQFVQDNGSSRQQMDLPGAPMQYTNTMMGGQGQYGGNSSNFQGQHPATPNPTQYANAINTGANLSAHATTANVGTNLSAGGTAARVQSMVTVNPLRDYSVNPQ
jgi:hypothetical protein